MKNILAIVVLTLVVAVAAFGQAQPNGPAPFGTVKGTTSLMIGGPHDFGPTGHEGDIGQTKATCNYCHRPHVSLTDGVAAPLWARASLNSGLTYGVYESVSLDATVAPINQDDNYSSFCLSCHDGSAYLANSSWGANGAPYNGGAANPYDTLTTPLVIADAAAFADAGALNTSGHLKLDHTHPVNFDYAAAVAIDGQLYAADATGYVWLDPSTTPNRAVGRLFDGKVQCSSCHNPHFKFGIGFQGSTDNGGMCVACHKK